MPFLDLPSGYTSPAFVGEVFSTSIDGTDNLQVAETYQMLRSSYARQAIGTESGRNSAFYLVEESPVESVGGDNQSPLIRVTRTYAEVPADREERVVTNYSYPGKSSGGGEFWQRYGRRRPITLEVVATDTYHYYISTDGSGATPATLDIPTADGEVVDFFGSAYETVPPYDFIDNTTPLSEPSTYTIANSISKWKGNIWVHVVRTVPDPTGVIG